MIKLKNIEGSVDVELSVIDYESVDATLDWCLVKASVVQGKRKFETTFPALAASELEGLLDWFKRLSQFKLPRFASKSFTEPCIEFQFLSCDFGVVGVSLLLAYEMKPNFKLRQFGRLTNDWTIVFELDSEDFTRIISNIESTMEQFPFKGKTQAWLETRKSTNELQDVYRKIAELSKEEQDKLYEITERKAILAIANKMRQEGMPYENITRYTGLQEWEIPTYPD